ncbi:MAG: DUF357 domain-containing protein [Candidatus Diapherotrites archaeon]|nr:DUF357 domain-containing protein [Candidatus Diapherotrites archaeon]
MPELESELKAKVAHYRRLTEKALQKVSVAKGISVEQKKTADDFLKMAKDYFSDAGHFEKKGELPTALAAYSYAHAWLDAGVRSGILDGKGDDKLFVLP